MALFDDLTKKAAKLTEKTIEKYKEAYQLITGKPFSRK